MTRVCPICFGKAGKSSADLLRAQRGSFHSHYLLAAGGRDKRNKWPRLLDCVKCVAPAGDPEYFHHCDADEFALVDVVTREKAWLERPAGATAEILALLIESHFSASAFQIAPDLWLV